MGKITKKVSKIDYYGTRTDSFDEFKIKSKQGGKKKEENIGS